jgi:acyl carrier protein
MPISKEVLKKYLQDEYNIDPAELGDDTPLFSTGLLDSMTMVELIAFIEKSAGITVAALDVNLNNLDSIARIVAYTARAAGRKPGQR